MRVRGILSDTWKLMASARLLQVASSLAFQTVLSVIPALAVSFGIFQAFGGLGQLLQTIEPWILSNLAQGTSAEVLAKLRYFIVNAQGGVIGAGGLLVLILTTMSMLYSIEVAINQVWQSQITRNWFHRLSAYWLFVTLGPIAVSIMLGYATSNRLPISSFVPSGTGTFLLTILIFSAIFKFVPHRPVRFKYAAISGLVTAIFWNLARLAFGWYAGHIVTYNRIYGSLAAIPILLIWIYFVWVIILAGVSLTAAMQKRLEGARLRLAS